MQAKEISLQKLIKLFNTPDKTERGQFHKFKMTHNLKIN